MLVVNDECRYSKKYPHHPHTEQPGTPLARSAIFVYLGDRLTVK